MGVKHVAQVRHVVKFLSFVFYLFYLKHISWYCYNSLIFGSLLQEWLVTLKVQIINSLGFKRTKTEEVKEFIRVSKTSINRSKALISVVPRLSRALIFSRTSSLIFKRLRDYSVAKNYTKLVQPKCFTTSTYTFNNVKSLLIIVKGKI